MHAKEVSRSIRFTHKCGDHLFPEQIVRRDTGRPTYRVSKPGKDSNLLVNTLEVSEDEMFVKVRDEGFKVRCATTDGKRTGLYSATGHSVLDVQYFPELLAIPPLS